MRYRHIWILLTIALSIIFLTACGQRETEDDYSNNDELGSHEIRTLSIIVPEMYTVPAGFELTILDTHIWRALSLARAELRLMGYEYELRLDVTTYSPDEKEQFLTRLQLQFMAGQAPDLFFLDGHNLRSYIQMGFLANIYDLIEAHPIGGMDVFYTEPLSALEMYGGLYVFPLSFGFNHVQINSRLPESILERFKQHETITITELMAIYNDLKQNYRDEFGHLDFSGGSSGPGTNPLLIFQYYMGYFIDFDNHNANLTDSRFINFIDTFYPIFKQRWIEHPLDFSWPGGRFGEFPSYRFEARRSFFCMYERSHQHVFWIASPLGGEPIYGFFETQIFFQHSIPLANEHDRLKIGAGTGDLGDTWAMICITTGVNEQIAWAYARSLSTVAAPRSPYDLVHYDFGHHITFASPIRRDFFSNHMDRTFYWIMDRGGIRRPRIAGEMTTHYHVTPHAASAVIERIAAYNEMPMALAYSFIPESLYFDLLDHFMMGAMPSDEFAQQLQNRVSLWLIE